MTPKIVYIIGAGQVGSRHLQALKAVSHPLAIWVVDPHPASLQKSRERYDSMPGGKIKHTVYYETGIPKDSNSVDLAIIATTSDVRRDALEKLIRHHKVTYLVLEKLLFNKKGDYAAIDKLLQKSKTKAWVNCLRRMIPAYVTLKKDIRSKKIYYHVSGSNFRLASNAIHFIDHAVSLIGSSDFDVLTGGLDKKIIPSKRKGFLEVNGNLEAKFKNGSTVILSSHLFGSVPPVVTIETDTAKYMLEESNGRAAKASAQSAWRWKQIPFHYPLQSQLTTTLVEGILSKGTSLLPTYRESQKIHLQLLESLRLFLNKQGKRKYDYYPFT